MQRILFQCNTVYQLLVCINIKQTIYKNVEADLILSDIMNDANKIYDRLKETGIFSNVFFWNIKKQRKEYTLIKKFKFAVSFNVKSIEAFTLQKKYTAFLVSNLTLENAWLYKKIKQKNKFAELQVYEDGLSTYSKLYEERLVKSRWSLKNINFLYRRIFKIYYKYSAVLAFRRDFFAWKPKEIIELPSLEISNKQNIEKLNFIFDYAEGLIPKKCKAIFFEESYYGDGKDVNDIEIVQEILKREKIENFFIKLHPRNNINRFENMGIYSLNTLSVPWELVLLNCAERIKDITLYSIASGALFSGILLFGIKSPCFSCEKMLKDKSVLFPYIDEVREKIISTTNSISYLEFGKEENNDKKSFN